MYHHHCLDSNLQFQANTYIPIHICLHTYTNSYTYICICMNVGHLYENFNICGCTSVKTVDRGITVKFSVELLQTELYLPAQHNLHTYAPLCSYKKKCKIHRYSSRVKTMEIINALNAYWGTTKVPTK